MKPRKFAIINPTDNEWLWKSTTEEYWQALAKLKIYRVNHPKAMLLEIIRDEWETVE